MEEATNLFHGGIDEDTDIDCVIAKRVDIKKAAGMEFQLKRFGIGRDRRDTGELIAYLKKLSSGYPKSKVKLLVCLDDLVSISANQLYAGVNFADLPFGGVLFLWLSDDTVHIKEIHPRGCEIKYPISDLYVVKA
ncbi:MAG: hypothetical protein AAB916_01380 [Patescibacteria group bacterium]|mgnify:CR=1